MNLPPHLQGVEYTQISAIPYMGVVRPRRGKTGMLSIEHLWNRLNEQEQHDLMMIALIAPEGDDTQVIAHRGNFRLWGDGEIYYQLKRPA